MDRIDALFLALDDVTVAREVTKKHDDARMAYPLPPEINTYEDFLTVLGDYYQYHYSKCIVIGGTMTSYDAKGEALNLASQVNRKDPMEMFRDAEYGTNGGIRNILDKIVDELKNRSSQNYSRSVFSKYVKKDDPKDCEEIARQLVGKYKHLLGSDIDSNNPERYKDKLEELILEIVQAITHYGKGYRRV